MAKQEDIKIKKANQGKFTAWAKKICLRNQYVVRLVLS